MYVNFTLKCCEKNKNGVGRESGSINDIETAACDEPMKVHYPIQFALYMFRVFHYKKKNHICQEQRKL